MARSPPCSEEGLNRGAWTSEEDRLLVEYVKRHGKGKWRKLAEDAGLRRSGKSCRLRWLNYLRPELKRGNISPDEEDLIIRLHKLLGNRWSLIAGRLPGRSDNEIKNYWNTTLKKKANTSSSYANKDNNYAVNSPSSSSDKIVNDDDNTGKAEVENSSMNLCHATTPSPSELYRCDDLDHHDDINFGLEGLSFNRSAIMGLVDDNSNNNNDNNNVGEMNDYGTPSASASGSGTNNCNKSDNVLEKILMDLDGNDHVVSDSEFWLAINDWIGEDSNKT